MRRHPAIWKLWRLAETVVCFVFYAHVDVGFRALHNRKWHDERLRAASFGLLSCDGVKPFLAPCDSDPGAPSLQEVTGQEGHGLCACA